MRADRIQVLPALGQLGPKHPPLLLPLRFPRLPGVVMLSSLCAYASASIALTLIRHFGATNCEIGRGMRKVIQVSPSAAAAPSPAAC